MGRTWLFLDSNYLVWRSHHALKFLSFEEVRTEVTFGYLKTFLDLQNSFCTKNVAHVFDSKKYKRKELSPTYKERRTDSKLTEEDILLKTEVRNQIFKLRKEYLPAIGCRNVFVQIGFEADDIIASLCRSLPKEDNAVIVSSDKDLLQLLDGERITIYNIRDKKVVTEKTFTDEWGITPKQWIQVKALAGCDGDDVDGIDGVGEKTAAKYLRGDLKPTAKVYQKIITSQDIVNRNLPLVSLPFPGTNTFELVEDKLDKKGWELVTEQLGMKSIKSLRVSLPFGF